VTATILAFFAAVVSAKQYVGSPIQCACPMEFSGGWEEYVEDYCFVQNTYYIAPKEEIPAIDGARYAKQIGYYQWVPIVLVLQAVMFYMPNWVWESLQRQSCIDLESAVVNARSLHVLSGKEREEKLEKLVLYIGASMRAEEQQWLPKRYLSYLYLFVKLLYLSNVLCQIYTLNLFIGNGYALWGLTTAYGLVTGDGIADSSVFPRVSLCDFQLRRLANENNYTVQCVLMINMFNEKV
jgi:hypothetical protein